MRQRTPIKKNTTRKVRKGPSPIPKVGPEYPMRINKYLAIKQYSTRRGADDLIKEKKVFLNGKLAMLGDKVHEGDNVEVRYRGKVKPYVYIAYNKPIGLVTHSAQNDDKDIADEFPVKDVFPVGRLDKDSHGLIILTNDGRITERLLGPKYFHEKEYFVKTKNPLRSSFKEKMEAGVRIDAEMTAPCKVQIIGKNKFKVILTEGKKHQIRRMCSALFQEVDELQRIRVMNINLGNMKDGEYRNIEGKELETLLKSLALL
jgi:23S rRNA pseudouridine2604 synthase